jgi:hypothetical protein
MNSEKRHAVAVQRENPTLGPELNKKKAITQFDVSSGKRLDFSQTKFTMSLFAFPSFLNS